MEIIFTLVLLIGFGINNHQFDSKRHEEPKQRSTSVIQQETVRDRNKEITRSKKDEDETSELKEFSQRTLNDASPKGKYISVRVTDRSSSSTG